MAQATCEECGEVFKRKPGLSDKQWSRRRFCSVGCGNAARGLLYQPMADSAVLEGHGERVSDGMRVAAANGVRLGRPSDCPHGHGTSCVACTFIDRALSVRKSARRVIRGDPCAYCGATLSGVDHIIPISDGGLDSWENWTGCCHHCNTLKGQLPLLLALPWIPQARRYHAMRRLLFN